MKIVLINHSDTRGGASVVSYRLMQAFRALGHDSKMLVVHNGSEDPHVELAAGRLRSRLPFYAEHLRIFKACNFDRTNLFKISIATNGLPLSSHPVVRNADAIILNWVNQGMLSLGEIARIASEKPVLWTMHDMWNITSLCHHAGNCLQYTTSQGCSNCPLVADKSLGSKVWTRKQQLYGSSKIRFVAVSTWLAERFSKSTLVSHFKPAVIANAFPIEEFYLTPRKTRKELHLPAGKKLILMGAARLDDPIKGLQYAVEALNGIQSHDAVAVFYGEIRDKNALSRLRFPHIVLGTVDGATIRELCAHATVVMSTSLYETLPGTLIEGMAAGATPVAFDSGGQRDIIRTATEGYLVKPYDTAAFTAALEAALANPANPETQRCLTADRFSAPAIAQQYLRLINS